MLKSKNEAGMFAFKLSDLAFLSKLDLNLELTAILDDEKGKATWMLHIKTEHSGFIKHGFLHGARGDIRKFTQLNALVELCRQTVVECKELNVKFG